MKLTGLFAKAKPSNNINVIMLKAAQRVWESDCKVGECVKIMSENKDRNLEMQGLIWETLLATLEKWNDDELITNFKILCPDPEGL